MSTDPTIPTPRRALPAITLGPLGHARGTVKLPGSKSISNRVLLLAALSRGVTSVRDLLDSDDTRVMLDALRTLGVSWQRLQRDGAPTDDYLIEGCDGQFPVREADLFMGNAGTAIRPLTAALSLQRGRYTLKGVPRMHERPIGDLVDGLAQIGARITYLGRPGYPPLRVEPADVRIDVPIRVRGDVSSQFLTALLLALPRLPAASGRIRIEVVGELISRPYVQITLSLLERFGIAVEREGWSAFTLAAGVPYLSPGEVFVEGDASSASYSWPPARSAAGRCASKAWVDPASRATCALRKCWRGWVRASRCTTTRSRSTASTIRTAGCARSSSTATPSRTPR